MIMTPRVTGAAVANVTGGIIGNRPFVFILAGSFYGARGEQ